MYTRTVSFSDSNLPPIACHDTPRTCRIAVYPFHPLDKIPNLLLELHISPPPASDTVVIAPSSSRSQACYHHDRTDHPVVLT